MKKAVLIFSVPESCRRCPLAYQYTVCKLTQKYHDGDSRPDWCPLEITDKSTIDKMRRIHGKLQAEKENRL